MNCEQWQEQIADYLAGSLSPSAAVALDAHLAHCAACARENRDTGGYLEHVGIAGEGTAQQRAAPAFLPDAGCLSAGRRILRRARETALLRLGRWWTPALQWPGPRRW